MPINPELMRLVKARRNRRLADEAMTIANQEEEKIEPADSNLVAQASQLNTPEGPLGNPSYWSKVGAGLMKTAKKLAYPGEVGAGLAFQAFDSDSRKRRREIQDATPEDDLGDFLKSSRKAYLEKDLPLYASLPLEIVADPLTYIPFGLAAKGAKVAFKGKDALKAAGKTVGPEPRPLGMIGFEEIIKSSDAPLKILEKSRTNKIARHAGPLKWAFGIAKGKAGLLDPHIPTNRILLKNLDIESKISGVATANTAKVTGVKQAFKITEDGLIEHPDEFLNGRHFSRGLGTLFNIPTNQPNLNTFDDLARFMTTKKVKQQLTTKGGGIQFVLEPGVGETRWLDLLATKKGLDTIRNFKFKGEKLLNANLTDDQLRAAGKFLQGFESYGNDLVKYSPGIDLIKGGFVASKVLKIIENANDIVAKGGGKRLTPPGELGKRTFTEELEDEMIDAIVNKRIKYISDPDEAFQIYGENAMRYMNNSKMQTDIQGLAAKNIGDVKWKASTTNEIGAMNKVNVILSKAAKGVEQAADKSGRLGRRAGKKVISQADIAALDKNGYGYLAKIAKENPTDFEKILLAKKNLDADFASNGSRVFAKEGQSGLPAKFNQFFFTGKNAEKTAARWRSMTGLADDTQFTALAKSAGAIGDVIRVGKTGFDFGFMLLQGLPMLGRAVVNPSLFKVWGKATTNGFEAFFSKESTERFIKELSEITVLDEAGNTIKLLDEYVLNGGQLSKYATDVYAGVPTAQRLLDKAPVVGKKVSGLLDRFERSFIHSGDVLKIKGYQYLRNSVYRNADNKAEALQGLTSFLNKATGALDPIAAGIPRSQSAVERAFVFFSPRYTRASFSLMADAFRGGVQGAEARKSLLGLAGFGMGTYIASSLALGQEPELDPRSSKFMTVEINGNRIGLGSFWMSFARAATKLGDNMLTDEDILEEQQNNPIFQYLRGRTSPITGLGYEIWTGKDYLGRPFESNIDLLKHIGKAPLPFSIEGALLDDAYNNTSEKLTGAPFEMGGMRVRPLSIWERRMDFRDELAWEKHGKQWKELNQVQKKNLEAESENLTRLNEDVKKVVAEGDNKVMDQLEVYYDQQEVIQQEYDNELREGISLMQEEQFFTTRELRSVILKTANNNKRIAYDILNKRTEEGKDLEDVNTYFTQMAQKFSDDTQPEDVAYRAFLTDIISNENWDKPGGYDWLARDEAIEDFKVKWGSDIFAYVEERLKIGQNLPPIISEYYNARNKYQFYWDASEQAVIEDMPFPEYAQKLRTEYIRATSTEQLILAENPDLKEINNKISATKKYLREGNPGLDAFLFRWGYAGKLKHPNNIGEEYFWLRSQPIELSNYDTGPVDFTNP